MHARKQIYIVGAMLAMAVSAKAAGLGLDSVKQAIRYSVSSSVPDMRRPVNSEAMEELERTVRSVGTRRIRRISVVSWASPEGGLDFNIDLARQRSHATAALIIDRFPELASRIVEEARSEGWGSLRDLVEADGMLSGREKANIVNIIDASVDPDTKKMMMKRLPTYQYLLQTYYTEIRRSSIITYIEKEKPRRVTVTERDTVYVPQEVVRTDTVWMYPEAGSKRIWLAVKTNLLYDAALIPNIGVEVPIGKRWSVAANWMYAWWKCDHRHNYWRTYGGDLEARYWWPEGMKGRLNGHHVGIYGQMLTFDFETGHRGYLAPRWMWGGGVSYGYSTRIGRRFNLDFTLGVGYLGGRYKEYLPIDNHYVWQRTRNLNWFGPTKAEVSLVYLLNFKKGGKQ